MTLITKQNWWGGWGWASTFVQLTDVPSSYSGQSNKFVSVKADETGLQFTTLSGGGDMLASVYDPAGWVRQVAFADDLANKLDKNTPITGATKTKITYDADGLVTAGADATTADIADSTNKRYVTDAQSTVLGNTSGTNTGDQDLSGLQAKASVVSSNQTAVNDWVYVVTASATFTDPSPVEGKWYRVVVRNGTATVWGTGYSVEGSEILRIYHSWSWANYLKFPSNGAITWSTKTKITYDSKWLVTAWADATTADISDSTDKRYVTDAQSTVLGNTSGTNTGDQTNISGNAETVTTINGRISAWTNVSITGSWTSVSPYVIAASWGWGGVWQRTDLTWTYASTSTFTFSGDAGDAEAIERCLFTCLSTGWSTRRIWYIKSASHSSGTITATVVTDTDLASWDNSFRVTVNRKAEDYEKLVTVPGEQVADASNPQGMYYRSLIDTYLLPVNSFVRTAAAGSWAACAWNVYKWATNLFSSAQDMTTNATFDEKRPNTNTISANDVVTIRVTSSAGATNKASDLQVQLFIVPQTLYTTAD